jgi:hypothetical protein
LPIVNIEQVTITARELQVEILGSSRSTNSTGYHLPGLPPICAGYSTGGYQSTSNTTQAKFDLSTASGRSDTSGERLCPIAESNTSDLDIITVLDVDDGEPTLSSSLRLTTRVARNAKANECETISRIWYGL